MNKIKIIHVAHAVGGVDTYIRLLINNVNPDRFENIVVNGKTDSNKPYFDYNLKPIKNYKTNIVRNISVINDIIAIAQIFKIVKKENPDIIHAHSTKGGVLGRVVGFMCNKKTFFTPNAYSYLSTNNFLKKKLYILIEKILSKTNSALIATSNSELENGLTNGGYNKVNSNLFNNCIEPILEINDLTIQKTWPHKYICSVGRPSYQKNIELMIEVIHLLKQKTDIHLVLMGVGHYMNQLETVKNLIIKLNLQNNVTLLNWTSREDVFNVIKNSHIYVSTARYEGLPYSVIESMALAKPCVVSNCDGNRDLIIDGQNGFLINSNKPVDFCNKILDLLSDDNKLNSFSKNALDLFNKNYNIKKNIVLLENLYSANIFKK
jgi:glycosyltransferase involved in cell wall biosynthesis